tara:strand:+ start:1647 stop:1820 length:174 start_codon:yes stop_codon:yes gene_type:complete
LSNLQSNTNLFDIGRSNGTDTFYSAGGANFWRILFVENCSMGNWYIARMRNRMEVLP